MSFTSFDIYSPKGLRQMHSAYKMFEKMALAMGASIGKDDLPRSAIFLQNFLTSVFPIEEELWALKEVALERKTLAEFKTKFVQKRVSHKYGGTDINESYRNHELDQMAILEFAEYVFNLSEEGSKTEEAMKHIAYKVYCDPDHDVYILPKKLDYKNLISDSYKKKSSHSEANYCIYCHNQDKDFCRKGMGDKVNPLGNKLDGCPLDQKVSEMNYLYSKGHIVAALAVAMIDNPLVAVTGHRICNDCMKSCIFQKQEPVDIPCIETDMVQDVLALPFGAEIYYLLSRWNPLCNLMVKENQPGSSLVVGLGPAGFALSYYLLREGREVTAIDSMEIKPLDKKFFEPIEDWKNLTGKYEPQGFGGVCEYGITDRWDKNNLLLIRMILERFNNFEMSGNSVFGKDIPFENDYNNIAICIGAGEPIKPEIANVDSNNIYSAFDYLMEANMGKMPSLESPILVLGAGLTAMDCAMEAAKTSNTVSIIYRKSMNESPSYRENHDELQVVLDMGVKFVENTDLKSIEVDESNNIISINGDIPAKSLIYAFSTYDNILKGLQKYSHKTHFLGDVNPKYSGTVVKAIASAKDIYKDFL